jgi:hypothetical protein
MSNPQRSSQVRSVSSIRVFKDDRKLLIRILEAYGLEGTRPEQMSAWIAKAEGKLKQTQVCQKSANKFVKLLIPVKDIETIHSILVAEVVKLSNLCQADFLPIYQNAIQAAIRSGELPLIEGQTAYRSSYTHQGVVYEQYKHYALLFLENPDMKTTFIVEHPQSSTLPPDQTPDISQKLDAITDTMIQLIQLMIQERQTSPPPSAANFSVDLSQSATTIPPQKRGRGRLPSGEADAKVDRAIDAIMTYNDFSNRPQGQMWKIGISALKRLTHSSQAVIQRVLKKRQAEIDAHHQEHDIEAYQNLSHGHAGIMIDTVIQL